MDLRFRRWNDRNVTGHPEPCYTVFLLKDGRPEWEVGWVERRAPYWVNDRDMRVFLTRRAAAEALVTGHPNPAIRRRS